LYVEVGLDFGGDEVPDRVRVHEIAIGTFRHRKVPVDAAVAELDFENRLLVADRIDSFRLDGLALHGASPEAHPLHC